MVKAEVTRYLEKAFLFQFDDEITESTDLFRAGILDSQGYVQLIHYVQQQFQVKFSRDELLSGVIVSLHGIVGAIEAKLQSGQGTAA